MIHFILIEPEHEGNIGATARVLKNFGFSSLYLVNPHCTLTSPDVKNRAKHAQDVLSNANIVTEIPRFDTLIATTGVLGTDYNIPRSPLTPRQCCEMVNRQQGEIGIVFGREGEGLHNDEIALCDFILTIPSSPEYGTLNLSHAVAIVAYELSNLEMNLSRFIPASARDKDQIMVLLQSVLKNREFPPLKQQTQTKVWKRMIGKGFLTRREAFAIMGFLKKVK